MSYIENHLLANETLSYRAKIHWCIFLPPAFWSLLLIPFWMFVPDTVPQIRTLVGYAGILIALWFWASAYLRYISSEFGVTNQRVIVKIGFIRRYSIEILLQRIESIQVEQTILGRIIGFGTIIICGIGGQRDPFDLIADPLTFRKRVQEQLETVVR
jgi:uncharacterized membrane protein YdbT with pleckstrin-like domain